MSVDSSKSQAAGSEGRKRSRRHAPDEARREILDSAAQFLRKHHFRDLTVGKVMAGTTLTRSAFYQYFKDVHDLIVSLLHDIEAVMHETASPWGNGEGEPIAALRTSNWAIVETCIEHGPIIRAIVEATPLDERLEQVWTSFMERWDDVAEARIVAQQQAGLIPPLDARRIAKALNSLDVNLVVAAFGRHPQDDPEEVLETMHRVWSSTLYGRLPHSLPAERTWETNTQNGQE
jgi:TetR/AcrR family transcriptional regulator, ethionamide resistance regulator